MNKKQLAALTESMVEKVAAKNGCTEDEARTLVGLAIRRNMDQILNAVVMPDFSDFREPAKPEPVAPTSEHQIV